MQYAVLGKTGFKVSKLGLGGAALGGDFGLVSDDEVIRVVHEALDLGINFMDTAPLYGKGESERRIGKALKGRRDRVILATKAVMRGEAYSYENTIRSVEASLRRLQTDYVDLIQLHEAERTTFEEGMNGTVAAFLKLKEDGKVRAIGVNAGNPELLIQYIRTGNIDTVQTYCHYMLIDHSAKRLLFPVCREFRIGVINGSPLGMGILADKPAPFLNKNTDLLEEAERRKKQLDFLRKTPGQGGLAEPAMRFSLTCPDIAVTLTGTASVQELRANASYCDGAGLPEEDEQRVFALFSESPSLF